MNGNVVISNKGTWPIGEHTRRLGIDYGDQKTEN